MAFLRWVSVFYLMVCSSTVWAAESDEVIQFADRLAQDALNIVKNDDLSANEKQRKLEHVFDDAVDIEWVSRFALGKYWRTASEVQRIDYQRNYKDFVLKYYTSRLTDYTGQQYKITGVRPEGEDGEYLLSMELVNTNEPNVLVDYRIRKGENNYKIYDIIIEGVSMITTQRSEFNSVIANKGLDYLIDALAKKAQVAEAEGE
jgi:phospholipid transport system substrate-binding protein